jgi:hypothetical protein
MTQQQQYKTVPLYGGAITATLPAALADASTLRPVPDTQEVWVSTIEDSNLSVIIDLLECVPGSTLHEVLTAHMDEVMRLSGASNASIVGTDTDMTNATLCGVRVFTFMDGRGGFASTALGVLRLEPALATDVLVSVNGGTTEDMRNVCAEVLRSLKIEDKTLFQ